MIFSKGSTFIFGSWIYEAGDDGKLQGHLLEDSGHHQNFSISATTIDQLAGRFTQLAISNPTQISRLHASDSNSGSASEMESYPSSFGKLSSFPIRLWNTTSTYQEYNSKYTQSTLKKTGPFLFGLNNMETSYQAELERSLNPVLGIPLTGAQEGLVLTVTSQDCIIHWPGSVPKDSSTRLVDTTTTIALPY